MQIMTYPLPPLMLTPIIEKCAADHAFTSYPDDTPDLRQFRWENRCDITPFIVSIADGYGRHACDDKCDMTRYPGCTRHCEDSDWVVTLQYSSRGYQAVYGITRHGDVQDIQLWMD